MSAAMMETGEDNLEGMAELAVISWKLLGALERELETAPVDRVEAGEALIRFTQRKLGQVLAANDLKLVTYEGQNWSAQIPANPLNLGEIDDAEAQVESTIEPTILNGTRVILPGKILLRNT